VFVALSVAGVERALSPILHALEVWHLGARVKTIAVVCAHLLALAGPAIVAAEDPDCPFAGKRPPVQEILKLPTAQRFSLCKANLEEADLGGANLTKTDLRGANLTKANLTGAQLTQAILTKATLYRVTLSGANLFGATLTGANLIEADLTGANLSSATLNGAILYKANLTGADLSAADLTGADITEAHLSGANVVLALLVSTNFEPQPQSVNDVIGIESAGSLDRLRFTQSPTALVVLRERFAKAGLRDQERQVTFAKLRAQQIKAWRHGPFWRRVEAGFSYAAFDLTCAYGLDYGRPLRVLGVMIPLFALVYAFALRSHGRGALWRIWLPDRVLQEDGHSKPERLSWETKRRSRHPGAFRLSRGVGLALLFSLLSAFQIGWRELNVGNWITRLQPREYTLRATGWVRVVAGVQSLLSVYLLALWALTYFGRPFE
jgi:Pentapeptide repeats (8 copies)